MFQGFMHVDGIPGEGSDEKHLGWIEIMDFDLDVSQTVTRLPSSLGRACAGRADFSEFCLTKMLDKASPKLAMACAAGTHIDTIVVVLLRTGDEKTRFMMYEFTNCMISSFITSAEGDFPEDDVAFFYGNVKWCYTRQARAGGWSAGNVAAGWNLEKNCSA